MRRLLSLGVVLGSIGVAAAPLTAAVPSASGLQPSGSTTATHGTSNPRSNVPARPSYATCYSDRHTATCTHDEVAAITHARGKEHVRRLYLPRNFGSLSPARQGFVLTDLERVDRGLPPFIGLVKKLNRAAKKGARRDRDPELPASYQGRFSAGSIWAEDINSLAANYDWMYLDGYSPGSGGNLDCKSRHAPGCWGHRDNILWKLSGTLVAGSGVVTQNGRQSSAQLLVAITGKTPHLTYTWRRAVRHGAGRKPH